MILLRKRVIYICSQRQNGVEYLIVNFDQRVKHEHSVIESYLYVQVFPTQNLRKVVDFISIQEIFIFESAFIQLRNFLSDFHHYFEVLLKDLDDVCLTFRFILNYLNPRISTIFQQPGLTSNRLLYDI